MLTTIPKVLVYLNYFFGGKFMNSLTYCSRVLFLSICFSAFLNSLVFISKSYAHQVSSLSNIEIFSNENFTQGIKPISDGNVLIYFAPKSSLGFVDVHFSINDQAIQNVRMTNSQDEWTYSISNLNAGDVIKYSFTYGSDTGAADSSWLSYSYSPSPAPSPVPSPAPVPSPIVSPIPTPTPSSSPSNANPSDPNVTPLPDNSPDGYRLIWNDEFNGNKIDRSKWNYEVSDWGGGNNELQYYTSLPTNSFVKDGSLVIQANHETYYGKNYTSARLNTFGKLEFKYGRVDVRAQLPTGQGMWPAIWLLPAEAVYGGWPMSGEIDIMELLGQFPAVVHGSLNYGNDPWPNQKTISITYQLKQGTFHDDYHVFSVQWEPNIIQWFVDGNLYSTKTPKDLGQCKTGPCTWRFDQNFYLILNVAVGGAWPGSPDASTVFPQQMKVDYVRVYQKNQ